MKNDNGPVRILQVVGSLGIGGIQSYLMELYRHIDKEKVQFDYVVNIKAKKNYEDEVRSLGGKIYYVDNDAFEKKRWGEYKKFWRQFYKDHPEYRVVHGHLRSTAAIYLREAKRAGRYTIAHSHATSNGYGRSAMIKNIMQRPVRRIADHCMGCSLQANEWLFGSKRANSSSCEVVKNGIDISKYIYNREVRARMRAELGLDDSTFVIGTVGRLVEQKNQELLIRAFVKAQKKRSDMKFLIAGDGPLKGRLDSLIRDLGAEDTVRLLGNRSDVNELLQALDAFAISSKDEGLGIAVIEAQAADLPAVVSPAIPGEACITDNIIRVPGYGEEEWMDALLSVERKERADTSGALVKAGYDIQGVADRLKDLYLKVSAEGSNI